MIENIDRLYLSGVSKKSACFLTWTEILKMVKMYYSHIRSQKCPALFNGVWHLHHCLCCINRRHIIHP